MENQTNSDYNLKLPPPKNSNSTLPIYSKNRPVNPEYKKRMMKSQGQTESNFNMGIIIAVIAILLVVIFIAFLGFMIIKNQGNVQEEDIPDTNEVQEDIQEIFAIKLEEIDKLGVTKRIPLGEEVEIEFKEKKYSFKIINSITESPTEISIIYSVSSEQQKSSRLGSKIKIDLDKDSIEDIEVEFLRSYIDSVTVKFMYLKPLSIEEIKNKSLEKINEIISFETNIESKGEIVVNFNSIKDNLMMNEETFQKLTSDLNNQIVSEISTVGALKFDFVNEGILIARQREITKINNSKIDEESKGYRLNKEFYFSIDDEEIKEIFGKEIWIKISDDEESNSSYEDLVKSIIVNIFEEANKERVIQEEFRVIFEDNWDEEKINITNLEPLTIEEQSKEDKIEKIFNENFKLTVKGDEEITYSLGETEGSCKEKIIFDGEFRISKITLECNGNVGVRRGNTEMFSINFKINQTKDYKNYNKVTIEIPKEIEDKTIGYEEVLFKILERELRESWGINFTTNNMDSEIIQMRWLDMMQKVSNCNGILNSEIEKFSIRPLELTHQISFSLEKTSNGSNCILKAQIMQHKLNVKEKFPFLEEEYQLSDGEKQNLTNAYQILENNMSNYYKQCEFEKTELIKLMEYLMYGIYPFEIKINSEELKRFVGKDSGYEQIINFLILNRLIEGQSNDWKNKKDDYFYKGTSTNEFIWGTGFNCSEYEQGWINNEVLSD